MRQDSEDILLALPAESKLLLVVFTNRYGEKVFIRSIAAYQEPRNVLICLKNEITCGIAAVF